MSAVASVLASMGHRVTGSDLKWSPALDRLASSGVRVQVGHDGSLMEDAEILSISTAVHEDNPEVMLARQRGLQVASRAETLAAICASRRLIAVSGTHGKTTTATLLALVLVEAGLHPSFLIGGDVNEIGTNAVWDRGDWLVVEADESDGTFLVLDPEIAVLTNVEPDHLDYYGGFDELVAAFDEYCSKASRGVVASADDVVAAEVGRRHGAALVGFSAGADVRIDELHAGRDGVSFDLVRAGQQARSAVVAGVRSEARFECRHRGRHGARNWRFLSRQPSARSRDSPEWRAGSSTAERPEACASWTTTRTFPPR